MNDFINRRYVIFLISEIDKIDFNQVLESSFDIMVRSVDNTKTVVTFADKQPECVSKLTTIFGIYTHVEILNILLTSEWKKDDVI